MKDSYPVGQAPWEVNTNSNTDTKPADSYPVGQAPWEVNTNSSTDTSALDKMQQLNSKPSELSGITDYSNSGEAITNSDGTISTTQITPEAANALEPGEVTDKINANLVEPAKQVVAGARTITAGGARIINDALAEAGLPNEKGITDKAAETLNNYIEKYNNSHPTALLHPSTLGKLMAYTVLPIGDGALAGGASIGGYSFLESLGENKDYGDAALNGIVGAALGGTSIAVINKAVNALGLKEMPKDVELMLNLNRMSKGEALKALKDIPNKDRALSLAESDEMFKNYFKATIGDSSKLAADLDKRLQMRKDIFEPFTANAQDMTQAKQTFTNMKLEVDKASPNMYDASSISNKIDDKLIDLYATDPSGIATSLKQIKLDTEGTITPGQALEVRENINAILRKPAIKKSFKARETINEVKAEVDSFLDRSLPKDLKQQVDTEISKYRETINNFKFGEILEKNTKGKNAVNWEGVIKDLGKDGLHSDSIDLALPVLKEFTKKFANDKLLGEVSKPTGNSSSGGLLSAWSKAVNTTLDILSPLYNRSRYKDIQIRKAIERSLKNADPMDPLKFVDDLVKTTRGKISRAQAERIKTEVEPLMLEYKPEAKTTGDVNAQPLYGTKSGTVSTNPTDAALYDAQTNLVRETLGKGYSDNVIEATNKLLNSKRLEQLSKSIKAQFEKGEHTRALNRIRSEVDKTIQRLQKDLGVKLPKVEVEKLYKNKIFESTNTGDNIKTLFKNAYIDDGAYRLNYNNKLVDLEDIDGIVRFDNSSFSKGTRNGKKFYNELFNRAEANNIKVGPLGPLIGDAQYRYPLAVMRYAKAGGNISNITSSSSKFSPINLQIEARDILSRLKAGEKLNLKPEDIKLIEGYAK